MIRNSKRLGQHFLASKKIAERVAREADISSKDVILEIGPGKGALTDALLARGPKKIIAAEKDARLARALKEKYAASPRIAFIEGDIRFLLRDSFFQKLLGNSYKVVSNIPYYLTSFLFRILFDQKNLPSRVVLMVQKEVARRIVAHPPHMNLLALSVQSMGKPKIAFSVPKSFFAPKPKVDSAVIVIENISNDFFRKNKLRKKEFFGLLHAGFRQKRKKLINNIASFAKKEKEEIEITFVECGIPPNARAENLSLEEWKKLYYRIKN